MALERKIVEIHGEKRYCVIGPRMAVDFHFSDLTRYGIVGLDVTAGLECHYRLQPSYMREREADFDKCWLTDAPCWCDGTSLYATEHLYPMFKQMGVDAFWRILEAEHDRRDHETFGEGDDALRPGEDGEDGVMY